MDYSTWLNNVRRVNAENVIPVENEQICHCSNSTSREKPKCWRGGSTAGQNIDKIRAEGATWAELIL